MKMENIQRASYLANEVSKLKKIKEGLIQSSGDINQSNPNAYVIVKFQSIRGIADIEYNFGKDISLVNELLDDKILGFILELRALGVEIQ